MSAKLTKIGATIAACGLVLLPPLYAADGKPAKGWAAKPSPTKSADPPAAAGNKDAPAPGPSGPVGPCPDGTEPVATELKVPLDSGISNPTFEVHGTIQILNKKGDVVIGSAMKPFTSDDPFLGSSVVTIEASVQKGRVRFYLFNAGGRGCAYSDADADQKQPAHVMGHLASSSYRTDSDSSYFYFFIEPLDKQPAQGIKYRVYRK